MPKIGDVYHWLSRLAAAVAAVFVLIALIGAAADNTIWIGHLSWLTAAGVALLFAIYFVVDAAAIAAKKQ
ncbi:hypothetical protein ACFLTS_03820 [Chloroflexota bacterium]